MTSRRIFDIVLPSIQRSIANGFVLHNLLEVTRSVQMRATVTVWRTPYKDYYWQNVDMTFVWKDRPAAVRITNWPALNLFVTSCFLRQSESLEVSLESIIHMYVYYLTVSLSLRSFNQLHVSERCHSGHLHDRRKLQVSHLSQKTNTKFSFLFADKVFFDGRLLYLGSAEMPIFPLNLSEC